MRLKRRYPALVLALGLALGLPGHAAPRATDPADTLLAAARMWDGKQRGDLARQMLEKYLLARPDSAEALFMLGELELRSNQPERAQALLERLRQRHPQAPETRDLALLLRLYGQERQALAQARLFARAGQYNAALAELRRLFPEGPPPGELALEYYRVLAQTPKGEAEARQGLERLRQRYPDDVRYELALTRLLGDTPAGRARALQTFARLARQGDAPRQALLDAWRSILYRLPEDGSAIPHLRAYLAFAPEESAMADRLRNAQLAHAAQQRLMADPAYQARLRALKALDRDETDLEQAKADLHLALARRPHDPEVLGGLGLVHLRRGEHDAAQAWFAAAARHDPDSRRWTQLARTARFWGLLRQVDGQLAAAQLDAAESSARAALALDPQHPEALASLAAVQLEAGQLAAAEQGYRHILAEHPTHASAVRGLTRLLVRSQRQAEARALLARQRELLPAATRDRYADLEASLLRDEADALLAARRTGRALESLEHALLLAPGDPWVRYDLARLYSRLGLPELGRRLMQSEVTPTDAAQAHALAYAEALYLAGENDPEAALAALARIPTSARNSAMQALEQRARLDYLLDQAAQHAARGDHGEALRLVQIAERQAWQDPAQVHRVAHAWVSLGETAQAEALMQELLRRQPDDPAHLLDLASILDRSQADAQLAELLPRLQARGDWSAAEVERLLALETNLIARQVDKALQTGRPDLARARASAPLTAPGDPLQLQKARARLLLEARDYAAALPLLERLARTFPGDAALGLDLARAQAESGDAAAALATLAALRSRLGPEQLELKLAVLRQLTRMQQLDAARAQAAELRLQYPEHPEVLLASGRVELAARNYPAALAYFHAARQAAGYPAGTDTGRIALLEPRPDASAAPLPLQLAYELEAQTRRDAGPGLLDAGATGLSPRLALTLWQPPLDGPARPPMRLARSSSKAAATPLPSIAAAEIQDIEARRQTRVEIGYDQYRKHAAPGTSTFKGEEIPLVGWLARGYDGHLFVQTDRVELDAEALPAAYDDAALFGQIQAHAYRPSHALPQRAHGQHLGIGYRSDTLRFDLGLTGQGFPVRNVVGGLAYRWELGGRFNTSATLEFSRRPITSSLTAYAGSRDPVTGEIWGGVVATGIGGRIAADLGPYSGFASLSLAKLTGKNVLDNERMLLRAGLDRDVLRTPDMRINLGLVLSWWKYAENQGYYTFGHGGYYSPQNYLALSVPVDWAGRRGRLSWQLRASLSVSNSREDAADFYPTRPDLQARAATAPLPAGYTAPRYASSQGGGVGHSLLAAAEYRLTPHLALGGRFSLDRSDYYNPNSLLVYLRYFLDPRVEPVRFPPVPVQPYAQF